VEQINEMNTGSGTMTDNKPVETVSPVDYVVLMRGTLTELQGLLDQDVYESEYALNLIKTAIDYLYYLEDNRRVIL
jgi:hypothetical protein